MIDFSKPLRVKRDHAPLKECTFPFKVMHDGAASFLVHGITGKIYKFVETPDVVENIPEKPQPKLRYQAQYEDGSSNIWCDSRKSISIRTITAWLIETDHGPDEKPRYTYEREEVGK